MRTSMGPLSVLLVLSGFACGSEGPVAGPAPSVTLTRVNLTGNTNLNAIGQTSQLTLTATNSDGTTRNVTAEANWVSSTPSVVTVSAGVVSVVSFGTATISASFLTQGANATITALPTGTSIFSGRVREPGGGGLANVLVVEQNSNTSKRTDGSGAFNFLGLPAARFRVDHPNYERLDLEVAPDPAAGRTVFVDAAIQRVIRVPAGQSTDPQYRAPNDVAHGVGADLCYPCKLIRVTTGGPVTLDVRVAWTGPQTTALHLWANGQRHSAAGPTITATVAAGSGEALLYVGWMRSPGQGAIDYVNFTLTTTIQ